jgi:hypothetical protein
MRGHGVVDRRGPRPAAVLEPEIFFGHRCRGPTPGDDAIHWARATPALAGSVRGRRWLWRLVELMVPKHARIAFSRQA